MPDILVVDDDQAIATAFQQFFGYEGHTCRLASNAEEAVRLIVERRPDLVMLDVRMPGVDGLTALRQIRARVPDICVVIMTAYGTSQTSIDAIRAGAFDYLTKPLDLDQLRDVIDKALASQHLSEMAGASRDAEAPRPPQTLIGETPAMLEVYKMIGRLATNDVPALVIGERGTGKQLVIATIHDNSPRCDGPFVSLHCGELSEPQFEASLFGTGGGTVQLESIELLAGPLQAQLARALNDERARAAGPRLTTRVIASTEHDLADQAQAGAFNRELYDALAVIALRLPPLRERRDDLPLLLRHFIQRFNVELNRTIKGVDDRAARLLREHGWPGNVGELERVIKRACIVARSDVITSDDIGASLTDSRFPGRPDAESALGRAVRGALHDRLVQAGSPSSASAFHDIVDLVETTLVTEALTMTSGNQVKAADILGVNRATLRKKMPDE